MIKKLLFFLFLLSLPVSVFAATTLYAVNAGGNWSTHATWSTVSTKDATRIGDASSEPVAGDTAIIDDYSGSVTVDVASACAVINFTGHTGVFTMNANMTTTGSVTLVAGMTFTPNTSTWNMGCATVTLASGGKSFYNLNFSVSGTITLSSALAVTNNLSAANGVAAVFGTSNITVGGNVTCTGTGNFGGVQTARTIIMTGTSGTAVWSSGGGRIACNLTFLGGANTITVSGSVYYGSGDAPILTYTSGVMALAGSTIEMTGGFTLTDATNTWVNIDGLNSATLTLAQDTTISGNLSVSSGSTLTLASNSITVGGNVTATGSGVLACGTNQVTVVGNVSHGNTSKTAWRTGNNTFVFNGTTTISSNATALGATFYNFTINAGKTVHLTSTETYAATGTFTAIGTSGSTITFNATTASSAASFNPTTVGTVSYVIATDINSSGGSAVVDTGGTLLRTVNWTVSAGIPSAYIQSLIITPDAKVYIQ